MQMPCLRFGRRQVGRYGGLGARGAPGGQGASDVRNANQVITTANRAAEYTQGGNRLFGANCAEIDFFLSRRYAMYQTARKKIPYNIKEENSYMIPQSPSPVLRKKISYQLSFFVTFLTHVLYFSPKRIPSTMKKATLPRAKR